MEVSGTATRDSTQAPRCLLYLEQAGACCPASGASADTSRGMRGRTISPASSEVVRIGQLMVFG